MEKLRKTILYVIIALAAIYFSYCAYFFIANPVHPRYVDCGKVVSKSADEVSIKYGTETKLYLNIQFEETGFKSVECDPTTYFEFKKDEIVCFNLHQETNAWYSIRTLSGVVFLGACGLAAAVLFFRFLSGDFTKRKD